MKIEKTSKYRQFKTVKGNRFLDPNHVSRIKESLLRKSLLEYNPIIVNENMQIIDGQHRLEACKQLGLPVYYLIAPGLGFDDIVMMNSTSKKWGIKDYLESYVALGYEDYITLSMFADKWGLSISNAIAILSMDDFIVRAGYKNFKEGNFEVKDITKAEKFAKRLREVGKFSTDNTWKDRDFIGSLSIAYHQGVDHDRLMVNLKAVTFPLHRRANKTEYLRQFEDVYNYNQSNRIRLY